jgi:hypothetical protein
LLTSQDPSCLPHRGEIERGQRVGKSLHAEVVGLTKAAAFPLPVAELNPRGSFALAPLVSPGHCDLDNRLADQIQPQRLSVTLATRQNLSSCEDRLCEATVKACAILTRLMRRRPPDMEVGNQHFGMD